ncbi:DNA-directed RNA polymerase I subunit RPA34.5-domain-containing protein [Ilyonectria sp. MPI-CAGE-AT-0026]|nr:DNA-directed RNA polymerase I subunit RPA34.5-domain-containing protein [Ilyonectria sp. MPI-CAGE-AT-0026]
MAPKQPFKVHSLSKHIENTKKGLSAESQFNRRPAGRAPAVKKDPDSFDPNNIFQSPGDDDEEPPSDSNSSSDDEGGSDFLRKLAAPDVKTPTPASRRRNKDVEIADSDVERNASSKNTAAAKKSAKVKPEAESSDDTTSSSDTSSDSESDSEAAAKPTKPAAAKEASSDSSSEESSSSESESESEAESEAEPETKAKAKPVVNGKATTATTSSSSSEESSSESENEDEPVKPTKKPVEAEADSSSSSEDEDEEMVDESMHIEDRQNKRQLAAVPNFIAPDFVLRKGDDGVNGKDVAEICNQANLEGKQFWYFTVPSNVPISVVQNLEIPMDHSQRDNPLFSHGGDDYGVSFESIAPKGNIQILIPSADSSQYRSSTRQVNQVMQVKKITQLASLPSSAIGPAERRTPRAQPKGLRSRYQPIGVNEPTDNLEADGSEAEEDTEMTEAPVVTTTSKTSSKKEKKRKDKDAVVLATPSVGKEKKQKNAGASVIEPPSSRTLGVPTPEVARKGKRKHTISEDDAAAAAEQLMAESKSAVIKPKKQKTNRSGSPDLGSEAPSTSAKKQTHVPPPAIPQATPTPRSVSPPAPSTAKKSKKVKEPKLELPILTNNSKQTPVPVPAVPHSSQAIPPSSPTLTKEEKRAKKRKEKESAKTKTPSRKVTPVPPPMIGSS